VDIKSIIPDEILNELIALRDAMNLTSWRVGDITNEILLAHRTSGSGTKSSDIERAVSLVTGKSVHSIRLYRRVSAFYPVHVRQKYNVLTLSHFVRAMADENWQEYLENAMSEFEKYGIPPAVDTFRKTNKKAYPIERIYIDENLPENMMTLIEEFKRLMTAAFNILETVSEILGTNVISVLQEAAGKTLIRIQDVYRDKFKS